MPRKFEYFVQYIILKFSKINIIQSACQPAVRPVALVLWLYFFHTTKVIAVCLQNGCTKGLATAPWFFL